MRSHYIPASARATVALSALTDYETAFDPQNQEPESTANPPSAETAKDFGGMIGPHVTPLPAQGIKVVRLKADYGKIVRCLRRKGSLTRVQKREVTLVTRESPESKTEIRVLARAGVSSSHDRNDVLKELARSTHNGRSA